jgi:hypothetical protein
MIERTFTESFSEEWVKHNINDTANELVVLRTIIPWHKITSRLRKFYSKKKVAEVRHYE